MTDDLSTIIDEIVSADPEQQPQVIETVIADQEHDNLALLLESLPIQQRLEMWRSIPVIDRVAVLVEMRGDPRETVLDSMELSELDALFTGINAEDLIELSESLPNRLVDRALRAMDEQQKLYFEGAQKYADDLAGHWVDHNLLILPVNARVRDALRLLRREVPEHCNLIFLVNRSGHYHSTVPVNELFQALEHDHLTDFADPELDPLTADLDAVVAAKLVQTSRYSSLPVIDNTEKFLGRINVSTAAAIVNEYYEAQIMAGAGLDEDEDLFSPVVKSAKNRMVWLGINLLTAFLASWFIGLFGATLQQVVALAVLMPVVASMGGIAGSQTLTLIIRGLALGQVSRSNLKALTQKELSVGAFNGLLWAIVIGVVTTYWFDSKLIGMVIAIAILVNILAASLSGVVIPVVLDKLKLDPALSGSVILTTVTDIVGFVVFLGLGALFLT